MEFQDNQLCDGLKAGTDGAFHKVQSIWDEKLTTEDWIFMIMDAKKCSTISVELECCGQYIIYGHLELSFFLTAIVTSDCLFCGTGMGRPDFCAVERA